MRLLILFALAVALHAEDTKPTVEQLQAQLAERDRYIEYLESMNGAINQKTTACFQAFNAQSLMTTVESQRPPRPQIDAQAKQAAKPKEQAK